MKIKVGKYQHYKGNYYEVIDVVHHSESLEELVLYKTLYKNPIGQFWVRPLKMFTENVTIEEKEIPRFKYIGEINES